MRRHKRKRQFEKEVAHRYVIEKLLGEGGFCIVLKAIDKETGKKVAIKRMDKTKPLYRKFQSPKAIDRLNKLMYREAEVMKACAHENIVRLLNFIDDGVHIYLVLDFAEGGELYARLLKARRFQEQSVVSIIKQVVKAVKYMHDSGYIHRDIKAENILFKDKKSNVILITDFGLSRDADGLVYTNCGTLVYSAPEVLKNKESKTGYDKMVDNWAIGVLTYLLLCGHLPFDDPQQNDIKIINKIMRGKVAFPFNEWSSINQIAKQFITSLLEINPFRRLQLNEALHHGFLTHTKSTPEAYRQKEKPVPVQVSNFQSKSLGLFPMMEASRLLILARTRWKVIIYLSLSIVQLHNDITSIIK